MTEQLTATEQAQHSTGTPQPAAAPLPESATTTAAVKTSDGRKRNKGNRGNRGGRGGPLRHGLGKQGPLTGELEPVQVAIDETRGEITLELVARHGEPLTIWHKSLLDSWARHEVRCQLIRRWLRIRADEMSDEARLAYLRDLSSATDARDRVLRAMNLHELATGQEQDFWSPVPASEPPEPGRSDARA